MLSRCHGFNIDIAFKIYIFALFFIIIIIIIIIKFLLVLGYLFYFTLFFFCYQVCHNIYM